MPTLRASLLYLHLVVLFLSLSLNGLNGAAAIDDAGSDDEVELPDSWSVTDELPDGSKTYRVYCDYCLLEAPWSKS